MIQHITYSEFLPIILGRDEVTRMELTLQEQGYYKGEPKSDHMGSLRNFNDLWKRKVMSKGLGGVQCPLSLNFLNE